jgi:hypothetical protein
MFSIFYQNTQTALSYNKIDKKNAVQEERHPKTHEEKE